MTLDPNDPFFESAIRQMIRDETDRQGVLIRQLQGIVNTLLGLADTTTERKIAFGADTLTYTASNMSDTTTITHGLGVDPVAVVATQQYDGDGRHAAIGVFNKGATTFDVQARDWAGTTVTKTTTFWWVALG